MSFYNLMRKRNIAIPLTLIACLLIVVCAFYYTGSDNKLAHTFRTATTHQPESFSELYFTDYNSLHHTLRIGKSYPVSFTITNHESKQFTYSYQTELIENGSVSLSKPVILSLGNGQTAVRQTHIFARQLGDQVELVVVLLNKNLTIHYKAHA